MIQKAVEEVGEIDTDALADCLRENEVETILGPLSWDETGAPEQAFLIGQWQDGTAEVVLPEDAATTDTIVDPQPGWVERETGRQGRGPAGPAGAVG